MKPREKPGLSGEAMMRTWAIALVLGVVSVLSAILIKAKGPAVHAEEQVRLPTVDVVARAEWEQLSRSRIYFGHQSVGHNLIEGLRDILREHLEIRLNIVETDSPGTIEGPLFAHSRVGKNRDPKSKIDAFSGIMDRGTGTALNIAFLKFCYVDVVSATDISELFSAYSEALSRLRAKFPHTTFVHVTIPLTTIEKGPKVGLKRLLGRPLRDYDDNVKRNQFNEMLRKEFAGKDPLFDLAAVEATALDGKRMTFKHRGMPFHALLPEYTDNGAHLNTRGRRVAAEQLLILLAGLAR